MRNWSWPAELGGEGAATMGAAGPDVPPELVDQAQRAMTAARLTALGARAGLVCQLTGLEKRAANRLYRQWHGRPSPAGQSPFTDTWFVRDRQRLLHAALVWSLHRRQPTGLDPGVHWIRVYESYCALVDRPLLDLTRAYTVPRLVQTGVWQPKTCSQCRSTFLQPPEALATHCPGCSEIQRYRCRQCGEPLPTQVTDRRRLYCVACGSQAKRGTP